MQLILVLSAGVAAVSAMSTNERNDLQKREIIIDGEDNKFGEIIGGPIVDGKGNPIDPKTLIDPSLAGTSKTKGDRQSEEVNAESVSAKIADAEAQLLKADAAMAQADKAVAAIPADINELINTYMTPEQKAELELKDVQKMWYGRVLKKFNNNLQAKKPIDLNELINTDLNEDGRKRLGFTDAQNAWFAGVLGKMAASSGAQVTYRPELKQAGDSEKKEVKEVTTEEKEKTGKSNTDGKDGSSGKGGAGGNPGQDGKDGSSGSSGKGGAGGAPGADGSFGSAGSAGSPGRNSTSARNSTTPGVSGFTSAGMSAASIQESWVLLAAAMTAGTALFI
ncbi:hypothetical protein OXX79_002766 [Metschnikowia pulcherrima]